MGLNPPDLERCQAELPAPGPFTMGGAIGVRPRCDSRPEVIVTEKVPGDDGLKGSMSLCGNCLIVFNEQDGTPDVFVEVIK